jgi:hypothetical protein
MSGIWDMTPEAWRYIARHYLLGPLQAAMISADRDRLTSRPESTADVLGIPLTLLGADRVYGTGNDVAQAVFFSMGRRLDAELTRRRVSLTDPDTKPGGKRDLIMGRMAAGGFSPDEIAFQLLREDADREASKANSDFRKKYARLRFADDGWDLERIRPEAEALRRKIHGLRAAAARQVSRRPFTTF